VYLPHVEKTKAASTAKGYRDIWDDISVAAIRRGARVVAFTSLWLRHIRTVDVTGVLQRIADEHELSKNTLKHIKSFISGIFTFAKQQGFFDGVNPVEGAALPDGAEAADQHAYPLEEIDAILAVLPDPAATIFACASYAGFRGSELRGLRWEEYDGENIRVERGVWESVIGKTKTKHSRAEVPVIPTLRRRLDSWRAASGNPSSGWIFPSESDTPLGLQNVFNRQIRPALNRCATCGKAEAEHNAKTDHAYKRDEVLPLWHGWHACRRGLSTNLARLGVPAEKIKRILRHSKVETTQQHYILLETADAKEGLDKLEAEIVAKQAKRVRAGTTLPN
jgi:integrase